MWNKIHILWQDKKNSNKKFSLPFGLLSVRNMPCVSVSCSDQTYPTGRNTCSTRKGNILLATIKQLFKDNFPTWIFKGSYDTYIWIMSKICLLMYSPLSKKKKKKKLTLMVLWLLVGRNSSQSFLRCSWGL